MIVVAIIGLFGIYYVYNKMTSQEKTIWVKCNDAVVSQVSETEVFENNYGGNNEKVSLLIYKFPILWMFDKVSVMKIKENESSKSAYLLFYVLDDEAVMKVIWSGENIIYSCSRDKLLKSWNEEGSLLKVFKGHGHWINTMSINTEFILRTGFYDYEQTAESSGYNKNCYLEEKSNEEKRDAALLRYNKIKKNFNFSSIDRIVTGSDDFTMILWSPGENEKPISRLTGHNQLVNHVMFSPNTLLYSLRLFR